MEKILDITTQCPSIVQEKHFDGLHLLQTRCITQQKDFEELFDGFSTMKAISYVVSPDLLLDFFDRRGYTKVEIVVGENFSNINKQVNIYKQGLEQKEIEITERLATMVEKGTLRIFVPNRTIHTKLYILQNNEITRVIQTSANLTKTAQKASRQMNYAWIFEFPIIEPIPTSLLQDYAAHFKGCSLFMGDLKDLFKQNPDTNKKQIILAWLKGVAPENQDTEIRYIPHEFLASLTLVTDVKEEQITTIQLPESMKGRKRAERFLAPVNPVSTAQNQMQVSNSAYIEYVYAQHSIPMMIIPPGHQKILFGFNGTMTTLNEPPSSPTLVNKALEGIEAYFCAVDSGESTDPQFVKMSMFEALLYMFFAPFSHHHMQAKRKRYGPADIRGPRFMYIYGPSQNGKSTFLQFVMKLLTMSNVKPLLRDNFTERRIRSAALTETAFPLVFDDIDTPRIKRSANIFKFYWENWWKPQFVSPQIIITSNTSKLDNWAKTRVKWIDFDVQFIPNETAKEKLGKLFLEDNQIFRWFSHIYLSHLDDSELSSDDELHISRIVMKQLYKYAGRSLPSFFPNEPIEKCYDPGRRHWRDLIYELKLATIHADRSRIFVTFSEDTQHPEINAYQGYLPQTVKYQRKARKIIIESPDQFNKWLGRSPQSRNGFFNFFKSKIKRSG